MSGVGDQDSFIFPFLAFFKVILPFESFRSQLPLWAVVDVGEKAFFHQRVQREALCFSNVFACRRTPVCSKENGNEHGVKKYKRVGGV